MGALKQQKFISYNSGVRKPEIRMPAQLGPGESSLCLQTAVFLCSHMIERKKKKHLSCSSYKDTYRTVPSYEPNDNPKATPPNNITLGI